MAAGRIRWGILLGWLYMACGCTGQVVGPRLEFRSSCPIFVEGLPRQEVELRLPFWNTGTEPLVIRSVRSTCGCSVVSIEPRELAPGQRGLLFLKITIPEGTRSGQVLIETNLPEEESVALRFTAQAVEPVRVSAHRLRLQTDEDGHGVATVRIDRIPGLKSYYHVQTVEVASIEVPNVQAELEPTDGGWLLRVLHVGPSPEAAVTGQVWIRANTPAGAFLTSVEVSVDNSLPVFLVPRRVVVNLAAEGDSGSSHRVIARAFVVAKGERLPGFVGYTAPRPLCVRYRETASRRALIEVLVPEGQSGELAGLAWPTTVRLSFENEVSLTLMLDGPHVASQRPKIGAGENGVVTQSREVRR